MTGYTEYPDDSDRPTTVQAPDIAPHATIEVQAIYGPGKVLIQFLTPGSSYEVILGLDTLEKLITALTVERATAAEFCDPEDGVFVDAPLIDALPDVPEDTLDTHSGSIERTESPLPGSAGGSVIYPTLPGGVE